MPVPNSSVSVAAAPMAMGRNGSWPVSAVHTPSYPLASALRAASAMPVRVEPDASVDLHAPCPLPHLLSYNYSTVPELARPRYCSSPRRNRSSSAAISSPEGTPSDPHGVALGGVDVLLELAHHGLVLVVVGDELVHLAPGAVGGPAQRRESSDRPADGGQSVDQRRAGLGERHARHVVRHPGPQAHRRRAGRRRTPAPGRPSPRPAPRARPGRCRPVRPGRPTPRERWRPA